MRTLPVVAMVLVLLGCEGRSVVVAEDGSVACDALEAARAAEPVKLFLDSYGCEGCNPDYAGGVENLIGCVRYQIDEGDGIWRVSFWVGEICSFRYGTSVERLVVQVGKQDCQVSAFAPAIETIRDADYCETDADCVCLSGSGLPFVGCRNSFHGPLVITGSYTCGLCGCIDQRCQER
jgi:hypothetical protein